MRVSPIYDRRVKRARFSDEAFDAIVRAAAERAKQEVWDDLYQEVGRQVIQKSLYALGALAGGALILTRDWFLSWFK